MSDTPKQPSDLRFYSDNSGLSAVSISLTCPPHENGVLERVDRYIPATGWFRDAIQDLYEAAVELAEMSEQMPPKEIES